MKKVFGLIAVLSVAVASVTACAGIKEGGGDEVMLFKCVSAPYVDSDLKVFGIVKELEVGVELLVFVNGKLQVEDSGVLVSEAGQYVGKIFDLQFGSDESQASTITGKEDSRVLSKGAADTLICTFSK